LSPFTLEPSVFSPAKIIKIKIYRSIFLPVVLYGCETWSLTLREERRVRVFENRVLRRIFGPKREVTGGRRKLHSEELHSVPSSPGRACRTAEGEDECIQDFGGGIREIT
jgi:hypothetical protein